MNLIGKILGKKYKIIEKTFESGMSLVFKARDLKSGRDVLVKFLREEVTSTYMEDLIRFKREIEIVSKLEHPNIVKVYDAGEYEGRPYFIMELLEGRSLSDALQGGAAFDTTETVEIIRQLAETLVYVHARGVIHRDIKPGNIFLAGEGDNSRVKFLDFGVSFILELTGIKEENEVIGTFGYMSPEAAGILGKRVDERSDLYSLGIVFYQLITGVLPFGGKDVSSILHQHAAYVVPGIKTLNAGIPAVIEAMIMKLLSKNPDMRYQSAKGLLYDLNRYISGERNFVTGEKDQKIKLIYRTKLVGRECEIEKLTALISDAAHGKGKVCLIAGEAGMGKSRLVEESKEYVYRQKGLFLRGRCLNHENKAPYQVFRDALDDLVNQISGSSKDRMEGEIRRLNGILGELGDVVVRLNPRVGKIMQNVKDLVPLDPERENQRYLMVLSDFFCKLAEEGRVCVLFLDDLHWMDEGSIRLLEEITKTIESSNLLVLGTYRDNEISGSHGLMRIINIQSVNPDVLREIKLSAFDREAMDRLVSGIMDIKEESVKSISGYVLEKSKGNPYFAVNILRELIENKALSWNGEEWTEDWEAIRRLPVYQSIVDIILRRISGLSKEQGDLLCTAAVVGRELDMNILYRLSDLHRDEIVSIVDEIVSLQLMEFSHEKGRLLFAHDRIRDAFYCKMNADERKKIHIKVARSIETLHVDGRDRFVFELTHHYMEGGDSEKTLEYVLPAARKAKNTYANELAVKYYTTGIRLLEQKGEKGSEEWSNACQDLLEVYPVIGRNDEAIALAEEVLQLVSRPLEKAKVYKKVGMAYFKKGDWFQCEVNIARGLSILGERIPITRLEVVCVLLRELLVHLVHSIFSGFYDNNQLESSMEKDREIIQMYHTLGVMYALSDVSKAICNILRMLNISQARIKKSRELGSSIGMYAGACMTLGLFKRTLKYHCKALKMRRALKDEWGVAQSMQFIGLAYSWMGQYKKCIQTLESSVKKFRKIGDMWEMGACLNVLGTAYCYMSDITKSIELQKEYVEICKKTNDGYGITSAHICIAHSLIESGDYTKAQECIEEMLALSEKNKQWLVHCDMLCFYGYLEMEKGNYDKAIEYLDKAYKINSENSFLPDFVVYLFPYLAETYVKKLRSGKYDKKALKKAYRLCREALRKTGQWVNHHGMSLRAMAEYYWLAGKYKSAERYFIRSIEHTGNIGRRYELAKCCYEYAGFLQEVNRQEEAKNRLLHAYGIFRDIDARVYIEKCKSILEYESEQSSHGTTSKDRLGFERKLDTAINTSRYISSILDLDELLARIMDSAMELLGAGRGILLLYPEEGERNLEVLAARNVTSDEIKDKGFTASWSIISRVERDKAPLIVSDALSDDLLKMQHSVVAQKIRSVICAPIMNKGEFLGVIYLDNSLLSGLFHEDDLNVMELLANQAGVSIENARLYKRMKAYLKEIESSRDKIAVLNQTLEQRVRERTGQLEAANKELKEYAAVAEELAVVKERNRIARDVHDTLGHTLSLLVMLLEASSGMCSKDHEETRRILSEATKITRTGLDDVRRSVAGLVADERRTINLVEAVGKMIADFQLSGMKVDFSVDQSMPFLGHAYSDNIYKLCQEALTNSLKHGKATAVNLILKYTGKSIRLFIFDNGCGSKDFENKGGYGLKGMRQRVEAMGGSITFGSDGETGFNIRVEIPLGG